MFDIARLFVDNAIKSWENKYTGYQKVNNIDFDLKMNKYAYIIYINI